MQPAKPAIPGPTAPDPPAQASVGDAAPPGIRPESWGWSRRQRLTFGALLAILLAALFWQFLRRPFRLDDGVVILNGQPVTLPQRIDPNTADARDLGRIPHLGETLAAKITQWRDARRSTAPDGIVFRQPGDLDAIPGIGKKLIAEIEPFLTFPDDAPATEP